LWNPKKPKTITNEKVDFFLDATPGIDEKNHATKQKHMETNETTALAENTTSNALANVQAETQQFELAQRQAKMLASSSLVPKDFQGNVANCGIAINVAKRTRLDPLMVCQNLAIIHGRPSWSATALIGMINSCGRYTPLRFVFDNEDAPTSCYAVATDKESGQELKGEKITLEMAKKEGWSTKNGSKWLTMPGQMLRYRAASFWSRAYASDLSLGFYTQDEVRDFTEVRNVTPKQNPFVPAEPAPEPTPEAAPEPAPVTIEAEVLEPQGDGLDEARKLINEAKKNPPKTAGTEEEIEQLWK
jgi:hypothetical protein